ncbi:MAG: hypothetical protein GY940_05935 [bacterium]|nr:hypothetical protein [bacterium]
MNNKTTLLLKVVISMTLLLLTFGGCKKQELVTGLPAVVEFSQPTPVPRAGKDATAAQPMKVSIRVDSGDYAIEIVWVRFTLNGKTLNPVFFPEHGVIEPGNIVNIELGEVEDTPNDVEIGYRIGKNVIIPGSEIKTLPIGPVPPLQFGQGYPLPVD